MCCSQRFWCRPTWSSTLCRPHPVPHWKSFIDVQMPSKTRLSSQIFSENLWPPPTLRWFSLMASQFCTVKNHQLAHAERYHLPKRLVPAISKYGLIQSQNDHALVWSLSQFCTVKITSSESPSIMIPTTTLESCLDVGAWGTYAFFVKSVTLSHTFLAISVMASQFWTP